MKKSLSVLLAFLVLLSLSLSVHAADGRLTANAESFGDAVTVTVHLDNPGIVAARIFMQYDADVLQLTSAENGDIFPNADSTFGKDLSIDPYTMLWLQANRRDNNTQSGTLCTLTFAVKGGTPDGKTTVSFTVDKSSTFDVDLHGVAVADCSCSVSVPVSDPQTPAGRVQNVTANDLTMRYKTVAAIKPVVTADSGVHYTVAYSDYDSGIVSVDANGNVTAGKAGTTSVTVTVTDESGNTEKCSCAVTVQYAWWQILIRIFLLGFLWY